jgi:seryl-tRNA synthetase
MLDFKFLKENRDAVIENIRNRHMEVDVDNILKLYDERSELIQKTEDLRQKRNENAKKIISSVSGKIQRLHFTHYLLLFF